VMPFEYDNAMAPWYSEASRSWELPQDWTSFGVDNLTLHVLGYPLPLAERADGTLLVGTSDRSIGGAVDYFRFVSRPLPGDGSIVVRVDGFAETSPETRAGVMIRDGLDAMAVNVAVLIAPDGTASFQYRSEIRADTEVVTRSGSATPYWLKLTRSGDSFVAWGSTDGTQWSSLTGAAGTSSVELPMGQDVYVGLAVCSGSWYGTVAEFSGVSVQGSPADEWQVVPLSSWEIGRERDRLYAVVTDEAGHFTVVNHPDALILGSPTWQRWDIPINDLALNGVDVRRIAQLIVGIGDRDDPTPGGGAMVYFDDFWLTRSKTAADPNE